MFNFKQLDIHPDVPVYFEKLPQMFKAVSLRWLIFVGSADDPQFGPHGLFHFLEHMPFKGTQRFRLQNGSLTARFERKAGHIGAHTGKTHTAFTADVHRSDWIDALDLITDMVSRPLLQDKDVTAERRTIRRESFEHMCQPDCRVIRDVYHAVMGNHPLAHEVGGYPDTIANIRPCHLVKAHAGAYDRSRCTLLISGCLDSSIVVEQAAKAIESLPSRGLTPRRCASSYGDICTWLPGKTVTGEKSAEAFVMRLYPLPPRSSLSPFESACRRMAKSLLEEGSDSPMNQVLREDLGLTYGADIIAEDYPDGGFTGLMMQASARDIGKVRKGFEIVLRNPGLFSSERLDRIKEFIMAENEMEVPDPEASTNYGERMLLNSGDIISGKQGLAHVRNVRLDDAVQFLESITSQPPREFICYLPS